MISKEEILKPIWYAFTALDLDRNGKVSKSQLKVLSHNLCTILKIPHNTSALEEHFKDDDEGPVSTQGYMPYLNTFILSKIQPNFDFVELNKMCWTLSAPKHINTMNLLMSEKDAFRVWCIFNFLSEDKYPLTIVTEELEYFLRKLLTAMGCSWNEGRFEDYKMHLNAKTWKHKVSKHEGLLKLVQPGGKTPSKMTNWGQAAFTESELNELEKMWQVNKNRSEEE
uniref:Zgc:63599 n=1 Tax=Danio rerio TaxID=7955 RepID=Q6PEH7_DANRE|nr:Zgc:63599 [Danio rerio]|eukprot:NP_956966.1 uncharacterized protein LOC393645 [Danio rerio]